uniref:dynamin-binding protein-like n=1 Tax=Myxine glutinosa TaxID=7769 RepID=UPI00358E79AC
MGDGHEEKDPSCMYEKDPVYNLTKSDKATSGIHNEDTQSHEGAQDSGDDNIYEVLQRSSSIYSSYRRPSPDYIEPIPEKDHLWGLAVQEIIDTERSYVQQLHICVHVVLPALYLAKVEGIDLDLLFGNIGDILTVSEHLLKKLEVVEHEDVSCSIGKIMFDSSVEMRDEYMEYCCNYDAAQAALEKYKEDPQIAKIIMQQESHLNHSLPHAGNLMSILIHPVQRIMRYTLLLDNLIAKMPPHLLGYTDVQDAAQRFKDINVSINDTKRQQDLLVKYRKKHRESVSERLSHLNISTVRKMSSRIGVQFKQAAGLMPLTKDSEYEKSKGTFMELHKAITDLLDHLPEYLQQLQNPEVEWLALSDTACKLWAGWNQHLAGLYQLAICKIHQQHFTILRNRLEELVRMPASDLLRAFKTPLFLIQKRNDKLLDVSGFDDGDEGPQHQHNITEYQTLHSQLLDALPKFCAHASSLYIAILQGFVFAHTMFFGSCVKELGHLKVMGHLDEGPSLNLNRKSRTSFLTMTLGATLAHYVPRYRTQS